MSDLHQQAAVGRYRYVSPLGDIDYLADGALLALGFVEHWDKLSPYIQRYLPDAADAPVQYGGPFDDALQAYFAGDTAALDALPIRLYGSEFQQRVWSGLREIPAGETRSYKAQAEVLGDVKAIRAVASANGKNPLALVLPCHRVIGSDGSLTGYAGGLERKAALLKLEGADLIAQPGSSNGLQSALDL